MDFCSHLGSLKKELEAIFFKQPVILLIISIATGRSAEGAHGGRCSLSIRSFTKQSRTWWHCSTDPHR